jgi:hypothetical protein
MALRVNIEGLRFRKSDGALSTGKQMNILKQRLSGTSATIRTRAGDRSTNIMALRRPLDLKIGDADIIMPTMLDVPGQPFRIMKGALTAGLFKSVMVEYKITGCEANRLLENLTNLKPEDALTYVSLFDQRAFVKAFNARTGRKFRGMTSKEWDAVQDHIKMQMTGSKEWEWFNTEEKASPDSDCYIRRSLQIKDRDITGDPWFRSRYDVIRLVEDIK